MDKGRPSVHRISGFEVLDTAIGPVGLAWTDEAIVEIWLPSGSPVSMRARLAARAGPTTTRPRPAFVDAAAEVIVGVLRGEPLELSAIPLDLSTATDFDRAVYSVAQSIPVGSTLTYGQVAARIGEPRAAQAVGKALGRNPIPILVPCHRVVGANSLGGFSAPGGSVTKLRILEIESANTDGPVQSVLPF